MANVTILLDDDVFAREAMEGAVVLNVGTGVQDQPPDVAAETGARPDKAAGPDDDVADEHRRGMHEGGGIDDGTETFKLVAGHWGRVSRRGSAVLLKRPQPVLNRPQALADEIIDVAGAACAIRDQPRMAQGAEML